MDVDYLVGVDGGGSGTRVRVADAQGRELAQGKAGPSALMRGIAPAWQAIEAALDDAFARATLARPPAQRLALGAGLAGANHGPWRQALRDAAPPFAWLEIESDAYTTLLGAHQGAPGAVVAVGTGSVGMAEFADGMRRLVGGWGFPAGDEGSGAWIGLRALAHAEQAQDGRRRTGNGFAQAVRAACGGLGQGAGIGADQGANLLAWSVAADQQAFAGLAPIVLAHAATDAAARAIVVEAAAELGRIALALDPWGELPLAWCGGLAAPIWPYLPPDLQRRSRPPRADAAAGALLLVARRLGLGAPLPARDPETHA